MFCRGVVQCESVSKHPVKSAESKVKSGQGKTHTFLCGLLWRVMLFFCWAKGEGQGFRKDNTHRKSQPLPSIKTLLFPANRHAYEYVNLPSFSASSFSWIYSSNRENSCSSGSASSYFRQNSSVDIESGTTKKSGFNSAAFPSLTNSFGKIKSPNASPMSKTSE